MRWNEIIIVYLAIGAPFAAMRWLRSVAAGSARRRVVQMLINAIGWPVVSVRWVAGRLGTGGADRPTLTADQVDDGTRAEQLQRRILVALSEIREQAEAGTCRADGLDLIAVRLRESVDQYASLSLLSNGSDESDQPSASEYEVFRVAGRRSGELHSAARCLHRRNASRLQRHQVQARNDLLQDLGAIQNWLADRAMLGIGCPFDRYIKNMFVAARELFLTFDDRTAANEIMDLQRGNIRAPLNIEVNQCNTPTPQIRLSTQR